MFATQLFLKEPFFKKVVSPNHCVQNGVRLAITLSHFPIEIGGLQPLYGNATIRRFREWLADWYARKMADALWERLNSIMEQPDNVFGNLFAFKFSRFPASRCIFC